MNARTSGLAVVATAALVWALAAGYNHAQQAGGPSAGTRVGVVDLVRVFNEFEQTKALNAEMERYKLRVAEEKQAKEEKLEVERNTLQGFAPDSAEYAQRMRALKKMMIDYKAWVAVERENMTDEHRAWIERTYAAVMEGIAAVARHNGIQVVVTREELETSVPETETLLKQILNRKVVYADPELDLTDAVLVTLNDLFAKKGGAKSIKFGQ
ncbi:MAG: OmpH family outer membrane protein [Phycisphaerae bacterium]|nr:OmpH family outer membrane protein [Phycisphaerae bacterium]